MESFDNKKEKTNASEEDAFQVAEERAGRIWAERNLEKWPAIWRPARAHTKLESRTIEREIQLPDGRRVNAKVKVGFTDEGDLTTEDQKTYYALVKHWQEKGYPNEQIPFSVRKLAKLLQKDGWGTNVIDSITQSLKKLRVTPFTWTNSYKDGTTGELVEEIELFNILSDLKVIRRKADGHVTYEAGYYRFNDFLMRNLLARHTKPVLFDTILRFKSDIAQLLYTHVDLMLCDKRQYERRTTELFADLGLTGVAYKHAANRKQKLLSALKELRGARLTSGWLSDATLERTKDGKDYKVVFRKSAGTLHLATEHDNSQDAPPQQKIFEPNTITRAAADLIQYFHKTFYSDTNHTPQSKELGQAKSLIANYGFKQANYIVEFGREAAEQTGYKPQTFGGILQYASRAVAHYEKNRRAEQQRQQARIKEIEEDRRQADRDRKRRDILAALTPDDYKERFRNTKVQLFKESPWFASTEGSSTTQAMIESMIIDDLERERATGVTHNVSQPAPAVISPHHLLPPPSSIN